MEFLQIPLVEFLVNDEDYSDYTADKIVGLAIEMFILFVYMYICTNSKSIRKCRLNSRPNPLVVKKKRIVCLSLFNIAGTAELV